MGKYSDILLVTDFDATLTGKDRKIPQVNIAAVERFMAEGGAFTIATGRSRAMFDHSAGDIRTNAPHIVSNGSGVYDYSRHTWVYFEDLPADAGDVLADLISRFPELYAEIQTPEDHYGFGGDPSFDEWMKGINIIIHRCPISEVSRPWLKLRFLFPMVNKAGGARMVGVEVPPDKVRMNDDLEAYVKSAYGSRYSAERPGALSVEVQCAGTTKGTTARKMANDLGRHILICAGDARNDLSMLKEADIAYITADAEDAMSGYGFRVAAPCGVGAIASIIDDLEQGIEGVLL
jgi:HAD superfamily hydrolase (TIGR01484 family)